MLISSFNSLPENRPPSPVVKIVVVARRLGPVVSKKADSKVNLILKGHGQGSNTIVLNAVADSIKISKIKIVDSIINNYSLKDNKLVIPYSIKAEKDTRVVRNGNVVHVYMSTIRTHFAPDNIEGINVLYILEERHEEMDHNHLKVFLKEINENNKDLHEKLIRIFRWIKSKEVENTIFEFLTRTTDEIKREVAIKVAIKSFSDSALQKLHKEFTDSNSVLIKCELIKRGLGSEDFLPIILETLKQTSDEEMIKSIYYSIEKRDLSTYTSDLIDFIENTKAMQ